MEMSGHLPYLSLTARQINFTYALVLDDVYPMRELPLFRGGQVKRTAIFAMLDIVPAAMEHVSGKKQSVAFNTGTILSQYGHPVIQQDGIALACHDLQRFT